MQSHALSFFHLSSPDLLLGFDSDPARRNVLGVIEDHPALARDGIALRKFGQQAIEGLAKERIHPSWTVPGGVNAPLDPRGARPHPGRPAGGEGDRSCARSASSRAWSTSSPTRSPVFGNAPTMYAGLVDEVGNLQLYDGGVRFADAAGKIVVDSGWRPTSTASSSARRRCRIPT